MLRIALIAGLLAPVALAKDADTEAARAFIATLQFGNTIQNGDVTFVPIETTGTPVDPGVAPLWGNAKASFAEPEFPRRQYDIVVRNDGDTPLFLPGGTVLVGGGIDRMVRHDHLIAANGSAEIRSLPAASVSDRRRPPVPFELSPVLAPLYLRAQADFSGTNSLVPNFVAKWIDFRNEGDKRKSLAAFTDSKALREYALGTKAKLNTMPESLGRPMVLGGVSAIHGRMQAMGVYGNNELLAASFPALAKGATYAAAALAIRSKQVDVPLPGLGKPDERKEIVRKEAQKLLDRLKKAKFRKDKPIEGVVGSSIQIQMTDGTRGRVTVLDGKVVHLILFPRDPFRQKLYGSAIEVPDTKVDPTAPAPEAAGTSGGGGEYEDLSGDEIRFLERGRRGPRRGGGRRR
ncbi:MAG: hypothetical protein AAGD14_14580 [Planctomycetota bacterium]